MKKVLIAALSLLFSLGVNGQTLPSMAGDGDAALFRGRGATQYSFFYNGTYLWDTPGFKHGDVFYSGRLYKDVDLGVNAHEHSLVVRVPSGQRSVSPDTELVAWLTMDGKTLVNLSYYGVEGALPGFYEVYASGETTTLFRRVVKELNSHVGNHNGVEIGYDDPNYRPNTLSFFNLSESFYLEKDGVLIPLKKKKDLYRQFPDKKRAIRRAKREVTDYLKYRAWLELAYPIADGSSVYRIPSVKDFGHDMKIGGAEYAGTPGDGSPRYEGPVMKVLPGGYFSDGVDSRHSDMLKYMQESNLIASFRNKVYEIGKRTQKRLSAKSTARVTGVVTDVSTGEILQGVAVYDEKTHNYVYTDKSGTYAMSLPLGENVLNFSEMTKEDMAIRVIVNGDGSLDIPMKEKSTMLDEAMISAESRANHRTTKIGLEKVDVKTISKIPSAFGEGDLIKAVLTLPGVKSTGDASTGFNVRGGSTDQNLILFNENTIYNPSHMFGVFSAFNTDVIDNLELYKSSIPVEYGGRISSVLDVKSRNGDPEKVKASLGIGLLTSHFHVEGPIVKNRTTFLLGGRTTYSDWILKNLPASSGYANGSAGFSDLNIGISHKFSDRSSIHAYGYWSNDRFAFSGDTTFHYSNLNASLKYIQKLGDATTMTVATGYDRYKNQLDDSPSVYDAYTLSTSIGQVFAKAGFKTKAGAHQLSYGANVISYALNRGDMVPAGDSSLVASRHLGVEKAIEPSMYVGDMWQIGEKLALDGGVRLSSFLSTQPSPKFYVHPEFRVSGKYTFNPNLSLKAGLNTMTQYIHLVTNSSSISPMDTWKLSDVDIRPQTGWQAAAGAYWTVWNGKVDLSLDAYYKRTSHYLDYKSGAQLSMNDHLAQDLVETYAKSYGVELMARKSVGKLTGWVSYTYSRALLKEMMDRGAATINHGEWYNAPHDKPHDVKVVGNYQFTHRYSLSFNVDYSTGRPVTLPVGKFVYDGGYKLLYSERNAYRIPDYFRLDLGLTIEPGHYLKQLAHMSFTFGCYNITGRKNAYSVYYSTHGGTDIKGYMVSVFATQIPYVNLNLKF